MSTPPVLINSKWQQARAYLSNKQFHEACSLFEELIRNTTDLNLFLDYAQALLSLNALSHAEQVINLVLGREPTNVRAHLSLAELFYKKGLYQEALVKYQKVLVLLPGCLPALINAAYSLCQLKKFPQSLFYFEESERFIDNPSSKWLLNYGMALLFSQEAARAIHYLEQALPSFPKDPQLLFHLGLAYELTQLQNKAIPFYRAALTNDPSLQSARHNLAILYYRQGHYEQAVEHLEQLAHSDNTITNTLLAAYQKRPLATLPPLFVTSLFDQYAFNYEHHLKQELDYQAPAKARSQLSQHIDPLIPGSVLDLGCGTGLMGAMVRDLATNLVGVDISGGMLLQAKKTALYDKLIESDCIDYLQQEQDSFDYITAIEVVSYLGAHLACAVQHVSKRLKPKGCFLFTAEKTVEKDWELTLHARYAYSEAYLRKILEEANLTIKDFKEDLIRMHCGKALKGFYVLAQL